MPERFSIVFAGTPEFSVPSLESLIAHPACKVTLVISQPDKPVGRKQVMTPPPVKLCAEKHGIRVTQPKNINRDLSWKNTDCDFLVVVAYGQILSKEILEIPNIAPVNVHASLLPRWRGASPIQNALLAGDTETGVTVQRMSETLDAGDILAQCTTPIDERETFASLHDRLALLGAQLLVATLTKPLSPVTQDETGVTYCSKLTRKNGDVDPAKMSAEEIDRCVRALVPWPGVRCNINWVPLKLLETSLTEEKGALALPCTENSTLYIKTLQPAGKKPMTATAWEHGCHP